MKLLRGVQQVAAFKAGTVATIGNFDGVHCGHQALFRQLRKQASEMQLPMLVMLFEPQPSEYFLGERAPARLFSLREKINVLRQCGADYVYCIKFDQDLASMTAVEFANRYIFSLINAKYLLIGEDFRFGHDRYGDVDLLKNLSQQHTCLVQQFSDFFIDDKRVSSTAIRQALHLGDLDYAAKLLGRNYNICGRVVRGNGLGRQWGFPTANLSLHRRSLALSGVYCVRVKRQGRPSWIRAVANLGCRPTIDGNKQVLEIHLFDFNESLYGEMLQVSFLHKLRNEIKFESVDALIAQIHQDVAAANSYFTHFNRVETNGRL